MARPRLEFLRETYASTDRRVLGIFRIAFGLVLLVDLSRRWRLLDEIYTDAGLLPVSVLSARPQVPYQLSAYALAGTRVEASLAFAATGAVFVALTVGYQTRVAQALTLLCVTSLGTRNLFLENGGTIVANLLAAWTLLLPLGDRYSLDARWRRGPAPSDEFRSLAAVGVLLQIAAIYGLNAVHKLGGTWTEGTAIHYVLWQNRVATTLAVWLRQHEPSWLSPLACTLTIVIEAAIALSILSPFQRTRARIVAVVLGVLLHLAIASVMRLGTFPLVMIALLALALPGRAIDAFGSSPRVGAPPPESGSRLWTREGAACALLLIVVAGLFADDPVLRRAGLSRPAVLEVPALALRLRQRWTMYADVPIVDGILVVDAVTSDGHHLDPFTGAPPNPATALDGPVPHSEIIANYFAGLATPAGAPYRGAVSRYVLGLPRIASFRALLVRQLSPPPGSMRPTPLPPMLLFEGRRGPP